MLKAMAAPIALFVYNRLWHTQQTIHSLQKNILAPESDLIVFSDGPRTSADAESVDQVRSYLKETDGFRSVTIVESPVNKGLARSIIEGVNQVLSSHESIIVMEDDLVTSPYFLLYLNDGLDLYRHEERVVSVHGYIYPVKKKLPVTFFLRGADCWGWATWKRGWKLFDPDGAKLLGRLKSQRLTRAFDLDGSYPFAKMLEDQIRGRKDSWAVRWHASAFLADRLTLYPGLSLVNNIGLDGSGTHSLKSNRRDYLAELSPTRIPVEKIEVVESVLARQVISRFHKDQQSIFKAAFRRIKTLVS
jgi:hypothetical protein